MAASRRYSWRWQPTEYPCAHLDATALKAEVFLAGLCEKEPQFYSDWNTNGTAFGFLEIHLTVHAKDRWKIPWRVRRKLLPAMLVAMNLRAVELEQVEAVKLPPHRHPNRAARWHGRQA